MKPDLEMTTAQFAAVVIAAELASHRGDDPSGEPLASEREAAAAILDALARQGLFVATAGDDVDG